MRKTSTQMTITDKTTISATIDWLQFTSSDLRFPDAWSLEFIDAKTGMCGYSERRVFSDGRVVLTNPSRPDMGTHCILSGSTLDEIERRYSDTPESLLMWFADSAKLTRIDTAIDAMRGCLDFDHLEEMLNRGQAITRARAAHRFKAIRARGDTIYVGAPSSITRLRIYDKAAEQSAEDFEWTRIELQSRAEKAQGAAQALIAAAFAPASWIGLIRGFCDFPDDVGWSRVMCAPEIKLKSVQRTTDSTRKWLEEQCAPALARYQSVHHDLELEDMFQKAALGKLPKT